MEPGRGGRHSPGPPLVRGLLGEAHMHAMLYNGTGAVPHAVVVVVVVLGGVAAQVLLVAAVVAGVAVAVAIADAHGAAIGLPLC